MNNNKIMYGVLGGIVIGFVLTMLFSASHIGGYGMMGNTRNTQMMGNIDQHFIEQMIPHHEGAIAMATLALQKSKRPEIKTLAQAIITAQTKEIGDMQTWYKNWFGHDVSKESTTMMGSGMMSGGTAHMGGSDDMKALENAADFDKAFIEAMIPHHQLAIMMAQMLQSGTTRPEMQELSKNIIESQSAEIKEMQAWYTQWYK